MKSFIFATVGAIILLSIGYFGIPMLKNVGVAVTSSGIPTQAIYAVTATTTNVNWTTLEISGSLSNAAVSGQKAVGATSTMLLSGNPGRMKATVCSGAQAGWITINTNPTSTYSYVASTTVAVGTSTANVTSTVINANYFATSTGQYVPANTCVSL
jgi:hypothetical protein